MVQNQILEYNPGGSGSSHNNRGETKGIFKIFAVMLLLIALVFIGKGIYEIVSENEQKNPTSQGQGDGGNDRNSDKIKAIIDVTQENSTAKISVTHDKEILRVVYQWDGGSSKTLAGEKSKNFEKTIDIPTGTHTLYITVIDEDNEETDYSKEFSVENGADIEIPKINISDLGGGRLKITATDNVAIELITYRWNDGEEQVIKATEPNQTKLEYIIDALKETNQLTVVAVDSSNLQAEVSKPIIGQIKPTISVSASEDIKKLIIVVEHEKGIKRIDYTLYNGDPADPNTQNEDHMITDQNGTRVEFTQNLNVGYNRIMIRATSQDGVTEEFDGEIVSPATTDNPNSSYSNTTNTTNTTSTTTNTTTNSTVTY